MLDLLIRDAEIVDGTGAPARHGDVGVRDGRIVTVGENDDSAAKTVDAQGLTLAPGFVDLHTHYDAQLFWDPTASPSVQHGVTTIFGGNCGFTLAPAAADQHDYLTRMLARVEGMPLDALRAGLDWGWASFGDWLDRLEGRIAVNAGFLVGHSALRLAAMGNDAVGGQSAAAQIDTMVGLLHDALNAGALGLSTSQSPTHNDASGQPVPSRSASRDELVALASGVRDHPGTTLEAIIPGCLSGFTDDDIALLTDMSVAAARPLNWNLLGVSAANPAGHENQLRAYDVAAEHGGRVVALTLPHGMKIRLSFLSGFVLDGLPGWRDTMHLPVPQRLAALAAPAVRRRLAEGAASKEAGMLRGLAQWDRLVIVETFAPENADATGRSVGEVAAARGGEPFDTLLDIVIADELRTGLSPPLTGDDAADWRARAQVWRHPGAVIGGSDAGAHLDMMCGAIYTTSLLGKGVREHRVVTLEEAVRLITDVPARFYGLTQRGRIAPGWHADLVLFDPATVGHGPERTRYDLPAGAPRLVADARGISSVLVGGVEVCRDGVATGALPGTVLRSGRDTETVSAHG
ncbi:MAG: amidohydrolase family protein [Mycobacterium pseudokansasii]|uniref:N-acyl-D-aspartate deacylase n=1 Tax=Mycobacterium pseudokansasii TaxID=2341080 RepID=A0A498QTK2_9MYCO|nr:amidohydrolase family protein [Mycobacterium pseudokansasii]KZS68739.1 aminoacylase [Mycobacterium kansasii]MBY0391268.1 amidohydrolase family protein [Mycobacterium pseudokansasii]VAZ97156.1 N-acyl-D-aspartate deacylase [Mycobacterium pseudokansasii]VAZ98540.1 N-acyl-D-aspartate deacylase [Mycobacterium pseudokansasii]VBA52245.1 N-acyl-D-aspartate deacylase [Mycobacterium pseudokansasii]